MAIPKDYLLKLYGGWYGKIIGIRHGSNVEGWTYEKIKDTYGEVEKYLFSFKNFAADDDSNGPIFFIRALEDLGVRDALYCDMGSGWNYSWYRSAEGKAVDIIGTPWPFSHNWLVFRK